MKWDQDNPVHSLSSRARHGLDCGVRPVRKGRAAAMRPGRATVWGRGSWSWPDRQEPSIAYLRGRSTQSLYWSSGCSTSFNWMPQVQPLSRNRADSSNNHSEFIRGSSQAALIVGPNYGYGSPGRRRSLGEPANGEEAIIEVQPLACVGRFERRKRSTSTIFSGVHESRDGPRGARP